MSSRISVNQSDSSLLSFLSASSETEAEEQLFKLVSELTQTTIKSVIKRTPHVSASHNDSNPRNQDALELISEAQILLISHLQNLKNQAGQSKIQNIKSYAADLPPFETFSQID